MSSTSAAATLVLCVGFRWQRTRTLRSIWRVDGGMFLYSKDSSSSVGAQRRSFHITALRRSLESYDVELGARRDAMETAARMS